MSGYMHTALCEDECYFRVIAKDIISKAIFANGEKGQTTIYIRCPTFEHRRKIKNAIIEIYSEFPAWFGGIQAYGGVNHNTPYFDITYDCPEYPSEVNPYTHFISRVFIWSDEDDEFEIWDDYSYGT